MLLLSDNEGDAPLSWGLKGNLGTKLTGLQGDSKHGMFSSSSSSAGRRSLPERLKLLGSDLLCAAQVNIIQLISVPRLT